MDYEHIYNHEADAYDRLVAREDAQRGLMRALRSLTAFEDRDVFEVGVGTGRITKQLVDEGSRVHGIERAAAMLRVAQAKLAYAGARCQLAQGDAASLPAPDSTFDVALAGWVFGHFCKWKGDAWREHIGQGIAEMLRVARPGGLVVIIETMGTGARVPKAPNALLEAYYQFLESHFGFHVMTFSTDYQFASVEEAVQLTRFFSATTSQRA